MKGFIDRHNHRVHDVKDTNLSTLRAAVQIGYAAWRLLRDGYEVTLRAD